MTKDTKKLMEHWDYIDSIVGITSLLKDEDTCRKIAISMWQMEHQGTLKLLAALMQTKHTKQIPMIMRKDVF